MTQPVSVVDLASALRKVVEKGDSCAFFITTADHHSALITVDKGRISGLKYRTLRGYEAIRKIAEQDHLRYQSDAEPTSLPGEEALDTRRVIAILAGQNESGAAKTAEPLTTAERLERLRERYIAIVGPIGATLFDEAVDDIGRTVNTQETYEALIRQLASHIDDPDDATRFRQENS